MHVSLDHPPLHQKRQGDDRQCDQGENPKAVEEGLRRGLLVADQADSAQAHQLAAGRIALTWVKKRPVVSSALAVTVLSG